MAYYNDKKVLSVVKVDSLSGVHEIEFNSTSGKSTVTYSNGYSEQKDYASGIVAKFPAVVAGNGIEVTPTTDASGKTTYTVGIQVPAVTIDSLKADGVNLNGKDLSILSIEVSGSNVPDNIGIDLGDYGKIALSIYSDGSAHLYAFSNYAMFLEDVGNIPQTWNIRDGEGTTGTSAPITALYQNKYPDDNYIDLQHWDGTWDSQYWRSISTTEDVGVVINVSVS